MPLDPFGIRRRDVLYSQGLLRILHSRVEITNLRVRCGEGIDHILVFPDHDAARSFGVFDRLLTVPKRCVRARRIKPGTVAQYPGERNRG